ncbi:MAG: FprA family A-type flavoprotein [Petrotogales bacterium]
MNGPIEIVKDVFWVGANDYDTALFENLWPLPRGVSYNSFLIQDEKVVLFDTVKSCYFPTFLKRIRKTLPDGKGVDYLIINHMEPDHSGAIEALRNAYPGIKIIGNNKTLEFLKGFYNIGKNTIEVKDGDTLELGKHKLKFFLTPMVHWPETMMSYEVTEGIIFSGDAFGGFGALNGGIFDDEVDTEYFEGEILRYFSNIVGRYSPMVQKAMKKLKDVGVDINIVAATHGPIWRKNPKTIIDLYDRWSKYKSDPGVVLVFGSMYGNTQTMMEAVARGLTEEGVSNIRMHNISTSHLSFIIRDIWEFEAAVFGSCTYNTELFPPMKLLLAELSNRMIKNKILGLFGSYSWSSGAFQELKSFQESSKWKLVEPTLEIRHAPTQDELSTLKKLGKNVAKKLGT